ncbi:MAG TPA: hypothetical protein P5056_03610 [Candidatus Paceibacterota bacterium]|nr:hypothetical protein [Candidatus Paceibacterota bacterium]
MVVEEILNILNGVAKDTSSIAEAMMCSRPESHKKFKLLNKYNQTYWDDREKVDAKTPRKQNFYTTLNYLKNGGFIKKEKTKNGILWSITSAGVEKLNKIHKRSLNSKSNIDYAKKIGDNLIIIAFDIPEKLSRNRYWLRGALKYFDFEMIQKSVWVGRCKLPEQFIRDLKNREILNCVDIFEVGNKGTLHRLVNKAK